jgi:hypothetical protein
MKTLKSRFIIIFAITAFINVASAYQIQDIDKEMFPQNVSYDPNIPSPELFLGRKLGAAPVRHHELVEYLRMLANLSDRLTIETIGYSHERRPILFLVATSSSNQNNMEQIKNEHLNLSDSTKNQVITDKMPVVTWLNYGVHGAESSGMDAALPTAYYLAAAMGDPINHLMENSVILITAVFNPDGHSNRISWLDTFSSKIPNPNPDHIEHNYDGRLARTNHYGFDLNRQWISITQPEPRAWIKKWHEWRPNLSVDYHEMGSSQTYYFSPGVPTRNHPLIPDTGLELMEQIVKPAEEFLDSQKRLYFHGDRYDHFFLGKGSSFPLVNGGVGMLHEASSARGVMVETQNGIRTYRENIIKHFRTSIANAIGAVNNKLELLQYQKNFYQNAKNKAKDHPIKAYVISAGRDRSRLYHFVDLLNYHRINVSHLRENITIDDFQFEKDFSVVVDLDQDQHTLIRGLFDLATEFEDSKFYDVSTWTLPLAYGMNFHAIENNNQKEKLLGDIYDNKKPFVSAPDKPEYAYAFEWSDYYSPKALYNILDKGLLARVAMNPFIGSTKKGSHNFDRGTIVISFDRQDASENDIHNIMKDIAQDDGIFIHSLTSGKSVTGTQNPDLGSQFIKAIHKPTILLVAGREMDWYNVGEIWHLLDVRMNIPVTLIDRLQMNNIDLDRYTHIIYAGGQYSNYQPKYLNDINEWVSSGGTLIGIRQGADWISKNIFNKNTDKSPKRFSKEKANKRRNKERDAMKKDQLRYSYSEKEARDPLNVIGGAIFSGNLDITHPIGFGYTNENIAIHKNTTSLLPTSKNPYATVIAYNDAPIISGYASETNQEKLKNTSALIADRRGKGSIILFADDPNFRATWYGTNKLFLNSLFFSLVFDPPRNN